MSAGPRRSRIPWRDDRGQFAGIEAIPFSILVFVVGSLLLANAWAVIDAKMAMTSAAREAARTYVEAQVPATAGREATTAAREVVAGHGRDTERVNVTLENPAGGYRRCARVTATATYQVPALTLPMIDGYGRGFEVRSSHSELIDPYRDGIAGGSCATP